MTLSAAFGKWLLIVLTSYIIVARLDKQQCSVFRQRKNLYTVH